MKSIATQYWWHGSCRIVSLPPRFVQVALMTWIVLPTTLLIAKQGRALAFGVLLSSMLLAGCASNAPAPQTPAPSVITAPPRAERGNPAFYDVLGNRYYVRASSDGYRERGIASWYGGNFHGRATSSGERYDMHAMTAAHTTLPIPTWVEVTNLSNGKRVTVKINDRGPFVGKRLIDLSYAAATELDIVRAGTARVEVRALGAPPPETTAGRRGNRGTTPTAADEPVAAAKPVDLQPAASTKARPGSARPAAVRPLPEARPERLFVEAGKFTTRANAVQLVDELKAHGFVNAFVVTEDGRRRSLHRVRVGPLLDAAQFDHASDRLRELGAKRSHRVVMR
jgi:rare lipoprotein A